MVKSVAAAPWATVVGVTELITGGGTRIVKGTLLELLLTGIVGTSAKTLAVPVLTSKLLGIVTVNCVSEAAVGVNWTGLILGGEKNTLAASPPEPGKAPFTNSVVLPLPAKAEVGLIEEIVGSTTLNGRTSVVRDTLATVVWT